MGTCTSRQKQQHRQLHKRSVSKTSIVLDNKQLTSLPTTTTATILPNQDPQSLITTFNVQSHSLIEPIVHQTDSSSLIQFYTSNTNNNNSNINNWMSASSSSSSTSHIPPRIPVTKSRLPVHQSQSSSSTGSIRPKNVPTTIGTTNPPSSIRPMSLTNRPSVPTSLQNTTQNRFGFIPRPTAPGLQQAQSSLLTARSRSISPSSTNSANSSSSSSVSQRLAKTQALSKTTSNRSVTSASNTTTTTNQITKHKLPPSSSHNNNNNRDTTTTSKSAITNRTRSSVPSSTSIPPLTPPKTDVNAIRDRYKTQKRMNFFTRRIPLTNSFKSSSIESSVIKEENNEQSSTDEQTTSIPTDSQNDDLKTESSQQVSSSHGDSAYASIISPSNRLPYAQHSQTNRQRQRASSTLSSSSLISDVLNQDMLLLDDDNCSLKSDDLICDYDDTLTLDSVSKNDPTDSCSSNSLSIETDKKPTMITTVTTKKPNIPAFHSVFNDHRPGSIVKHSSIDKTNNNLRESLDELSRLSTRMDSTGDNEHNRNRLLTRSVSLKPPATSLPPREDAEQITMDIESYRQVMKDVMVVKTILHQLDRLLKHSDGTNMTDSMIGSFHESMISSRHFSSSGGGGGGSDGNILNSIDENSSYDDLVKEIMILRKEREQDKQTIKLLQEQMYKYSSQTND